MSEVEVNQYRDFMWEHGELSWLCFDYQDTMYNDLWDFFKESDEKIYVVNCSRRFGKTTILIIIALEFALRKENTLIRFAMPYQKEAKSIVRVAMRELLETCPDHLKPKWKQQDGYWQFPNGSDLDRDWETQVR